jgi:multicomponent Na+:H+ antiporter subunit C
MTYILCLMLFGVGLYCVVAKRNIVKIILGVAIMEYAVNLLFILFGYRMNGRAPILDSVQQIQDIVDPLPQALVLTAIVIGLGTTALMAAVAIKIHEKYGTFDVTKIRRLKG